MTGLRIAAALDESDEASIDESISPIQGPYPFIRCRCLFASVAGGSACAAIRIVCILIKTIHTL